MRHTEKECRGMHCRCMGVDCPNHHYGDHVQANGFTPMEEKQQASLKSNDKNAGEEKAKCPTCGKGLEMTVAQLIAANAVGGRCFECVMKDNAVPQASHSKSKDSNWLCGKCEQEKHGYGGEIIPEHFRTCPLRVKDNLIENLVKEVWDIAKDDSQASAKIGSPSVYTREKLQVILSDLYTKAEAAGREKGEDSRAMKVVFHEPSYEKGRHDGSRDEAFYVAEALERGKEIGRMENDHYDLGLTHRRIKKDYMTHIEQAIKEAVEKGGMEKPLGSSSSFVNQQLTLMRPVFWQALGKARGWEEKIRHMSGGVEIDPVGRHKCGIECERGRDGYKNVWQSYWHDLIDHLASGSDAESFFKILI